jgi:hypothetical protein
VRFDVYGGAEDPCAPARCYWASGDTIPWPCLADRSVSLLSPIAHRRKYFRVQSTLVISLFSIAVNTRSGKGCCLRGQCGDV